MKAKFNDDFRQTIVDLYNSGKSAIDLSREYGISKATIYQWINKISPVYITNNATSSSDNVESLKKEILKLKEENEILKKATAIFARKT